MVSRKWFSCLTAIILSFVFVISGCSSSNSGTDNNTGKDEKVTIRFYMGDGEITKEQITAFNEEHPNINLERVDTDFNKLMGYIAAKSELTPDLLRVNGANEFPFYASRGLALNLQKYFDESDVFKKEDLLDVGNIFKWDGTKPGDGDLYGFVKDWSPDFNLWISKKLFTDAGITIPSDKESLTWDQVMEYAKKLTKKDGDKFVQWGLWDPFLGGAVVSQDTLIAQLASMGKSLYSEDNSQILLDDPEVKKLMQYWVDGTMAPVGPSSLNSEAQSWIDLFATEKVGMMMAGYWFSGILRGNEAAKTHLEDFIMLPSPIMPGGKRVEATRSGTGGVIYSGTKHPEEAWTVFEWFFGGTPADDRAKSGWGLPGFKSKVALLPKDTPFDKQTYDVVNDNLKHLDVLSYNPYISATALGVIFDKYLTPVYFGKDTLDGAIDNIKKETEIQIKENKDIVGVK